MEAPTKPMLKEDAEAGFYKAPRLEDRYPRIQILTIKSCWRAGGGLSAAVGSDVQEGTESTEGDGRADSSEWDGD